MTQVDSHQAYAFRSALSPDEGEAGLLVFDQRSHCDGIHPGPIARCWPSRPDLRKLWPSRLVATAAEDRLSDDEPVMVPGEIIGFWCEDTERSNDTVAYLFSHNNSSGCEDDDCLEFDEAGFIAPCLPIKTGPPWPRTCQLDGPGALDCGRERERKREQRR